MCSDDGIYDPLFIFIVNAIYQEMFFSAHRKNLYENSILMLKLFEIDQFNGYRLKTFMFQFYSTVSIMFTQKGRTIQSYFTQLTAWRGQLTFYCQFNHLLFFYLLDCLISNNNFKIEIENKAMDQIVQSYGYPQSYSVVWWVCPSYLSNYVQTIQPIKSFATSSLQQKIVDPPFPINIMVPQNNVQEHTKSVDPEVNLDSQFLPYLSTTKKHNNLLESKRQKKGRNIFSNIFRSFLKYINSKQFYQGQFLRIRKKMTKEQFIMRLKENSKPFQNYVKKQQIFQFLSKSTSLENDHEFNKIVRIALIFYIKNIHVLTIYNSKKINSNFKRLHLKELRLFQISVREIFKWAKIENFQDLNQNFKNFQS